MENPLDPSAWFALRAVVAISMLLLVPLGLRVVAAGRPGLMTLARWWPAVAAPAAIAQALPRGWAAGLLSAPYAAATLAAPLLGLAGMRRRPAALAQAAALFSLPVAAGGLLAERAGFALFGFPPVVLGLTAAHFHVAGFGALLLVALVAEDGRRAARVAAALAVAGVAAVGAGFMYGRIDEAAGDAVELAGAGLLTAGLWLALSLEVRRRRWVAALLALAVATMILALSWAAGHVAGWAHPSLTWMVLTHGVLNATAVIAAVLVVWLGRTRPPWATQRMAHPVGRGIDRFEAAAEALFRWDMHRGAGAWVDPVTPDAVPGLRMVSRLGVGPAAGPLRMSEPCEVLVARREQLLDGGAMATMRYRAMQGHVFEGEEEFAVVIDPGGEVRFEVTVISRPRAWYARLAAPAVAPAQRVFVGRCARALRDAPLLVAVR